MIIMMFKLQSQLHDDNGDGNVDYVYDDDYDNDGDDDNDADHHYYHDDHDGHDVPIYHFFLNRDQNRKSQTASTRSQYLHIVVGI